MDTPGSCLELAWVEGLSSDLCMQWFTINLHCQHCQGLYDLPSSFLFLTLWFKGYLGWLNNHKEVLSWFCGATYHPWLNRPTFKCIPSFLFWHFRWHYAVSFLLYDSIVCDLKGIYQLCLTGQTTELVVLILLNVDIDLEIVEIQNLAQWISRVT